MTEPNGNGNGDFVKIPVRLLRKWKEILGVLVSIVGVLWSIKATVRSEMTSAATSVTRQLIAEHEQRERALLDLYVRREELTSKDGGLVTLQVAAMQPQIDGVKSDMRQLQGVIRDLYALYAQILKTEEARAARERGDQKGG